MFSIFVAVALQHITSQFFLQHQVLRKKDDEHESPKNTEESLRNFLHKEMKISSEDLEGIQFERVHRLPKRPNKDKKQAPRPIIAKMTFFQDKEFIKSHIKNLPKGKK